MGASAVHMTEWAGRGDTSETGGMRCEGGASLTDEAVVARHLLPFRARLDRIVDVQCLVRLEIAGRREGGQLGVDLALRLS